MKFTFEIDLSNQEIRLLQLNSLERVHGTTKRILEEANINFDLCELAEEAEICLQDLEALSPLTVKLWASIRNEVMRS